MVEATKDFFRLHNDIMSQYKSFANSFVDIDDPQILEALKVYGDEKSMWPDPLIQFNPSYQEGCSLRQLVDDTGKLLKKSPTPKPKKKPKDTESLTLNF